MIGSPPIVLPSAMASLCLVFSKSSRAEQFAQENGLAPLVRQFDADGVAALHDGDAGRDRRHRARDVVGKADHARGFDAGRGLQLIERDDGTRAHIDDFALDAEILEHAFEQPRILRQRILGNLGRDAILRLGQHAERRQDIFAAAEAVPQRGMRLLLGALPRPHRRRRRPDDAPRRSSRIARLHPAGAALLAGGGARGRRRIGSRVENRLGDAGLGPCAGRGAEIERLRTAKRLAKHLIVRRHHRIEVARTEPRRGSPGRRGRRRRARGATARDLARERRLEADRRVDHRAKGDEGDPRAAGVVVLGPRLSPHARAIILAVFIEIVELIAKGDAGGERQN